jgi:hypothetical protein
VSPTGSAPPPAALPQPPPDRARPEAIAEDLADQLAAAWQRGRRPLSEEFLARFPTLREHRDAFLRLICEELWARREAGLEPSTEELVGRFPEWRDELKALLACHRLIRQTPDGAAEGAAAPGRCFIALPQVSGPPTAPGLRCRTVRHGVAVRGDC